ncbi:unnamed protein product [Penicillium bialowiezense]
MKSPLYVLAVLLPLATELALGSPTPETEFESLEERGRGGDKDWDGHPGWHDNNPCEVKRSYPYYKYPCDSSVTTGMSQVGATFMPSCRNGNSGVWYLAPKGWVKDSDKPRRCPGAKNPCP